MRSTTLWLAGAVPWIAYVFTCSAHAYWLDGGEFVAAAVGLDVAHPPGHPLTQLYGKAWSLVPLGSMPLRIAVGQACATALASVCVWRATAAVLETQGVADSVRWAGALFAAWLSAFTYGLWVQAVRPEVYALQTLCTALVLERVASFYAEPPRSPTPAARYAGPACFALGLGFANHHFTALFIVPALLWPAFRILRRGQLRTLLGAAALGALALAVYAYLPLRAAHPLRMNLGQPDSFSRFMWVVSARVYTQGTGNAAGFSLVERMSDVLVLLVESFSALPLLAAIVGAYVLLRRPATRELGVFLLLLGGPILVARAWLGPVSSNPDVLGYFGGPLLAVAVLAASAAGALFSTIRARSAPRWAIALPALALLHAPSAAERASLADFDATDSFDELRLRRLPPRSVVVETMPQTVFRHWELDAVEHVRPDLAQIPIPFLTHPGMSSAVVRRDPQTRGIVAGYLQGDRLRCNDLQSAARIQASWLELDIRVPPACYPLLVPARLSHRVLGHPQPLSAAALHRLLETEYAQLYAAIGTAKDEIETRRQLLAMHYLNAAHLAAIGERGVAREEIARAQRLAPLDRNVRALATALAGGEGRLEIEPFLQL